MLRTCLIARSISMLNPAALFVLRGNETAGQAAQLLIQRFELTGLTVQLGENADLRSQQFWNDRNGKVIYRTSLVSLEAVQVGQVHGGDKDDSGLLKARMLAN